MLDRLRWYLFFVFSYPKFVFPILLVLRRGQSSPQILVSIRYYFAGLVVAVVEQETVSEETLLDCYINRCTATFYVL